MAELEDDRAAELRIETAVGESGEPLIRLLGELDISNVEQLRSAVGAATASAPAELTFQLDSLRFIDSAGISVLLRAAREGTRVRLLDPTKAVRRVIELTGLSEVLEIEP